MENNTTARDVFMYLLVLIVLAMSAGNLGTLLFQYVNIYVPDASIQQCYGTSCTDAIRWSLGEMSAKSLRSQQMLDVIQARIQSGPPIRTNPAAVLRGILRKYHADSGSFDPSSGFHIADQRRRRAEAEARLRAEAERREREREREALCGASLGAAEVRRQAIESMRRTLRGH